MSHTLYMFFSGKIVWLVVEAPWKMMEWKSDWRKSSQLLGKIIQVFETTNQSSMGLHGGVFSKPPEIPSGKHTKSKLERSTILLMGKLTNSTGPFFHVANSLFTRPGKWNFYWNQQPSGYDEHSYGTKGLPRLPRYTATWRLRLPWLPFPPFLGASPVPMSSACGDGWGDRNGCKCS